MDHLTGHVKTILGANTAGAHGFLTGSMAARVALDLGGATTADGDDITITMTPSAAEALARSLIIQADLARYEQRQRDPGALTRH